MAQVSYSQPAICWRSTFAGIFIAALVMVILSSLGLAFGGIGLYDGSSFSSAGTFAGLWFLASVAISLLAGSYFASRMSAVAVGGTGSAQGLVIASLFIVFFVYQAARTVGAVGSATGSAVAGTASLATSGAQQVSKIPAVNEVVEDALGDLNIQPDKIQGVVTGVITRLINGNTDGAKTYLARQTGITPAQAEAKIGQLQTQTQQALVQTREGAAKAMQMSGWAMFALSILAAVASVIGGRLGSYTNDREPSRSRGPASRPVPTNN